VVVRVSGDRAERFALPAEIPETRLESALARCPDRVVVAGLGRLKDGSTGVRERTVLYELAPDDVAAPGGLAFRVLASDDLVALGDFALYAGRPAALLADTGSAGGPRGVGMLHRSGHFVRLFSGERPRFLRAPLEPLAVARNGSGLLLVAGADARLTLGLPAR
jgi:hypothetical protein